MSNATNTVTYTGITNDLMRRVYEHKNKLIEGFTKIYNINKLVHYEVCENVAGAIFREKQIKAYKRAKKVSLISISNPNWTDLYQALLEKG